MATGASTAGTGSKLGMEVRNLKRSQYHEVSYCLLRTDIYSLSLWDAQIHAEPPTMDYEAILGSDQGVKQWTSLIVRHGRKSPKPTILTESRLEKVGLLLRRRMPRQRRSHPSSHRTHSLHPPHPLRYLAPSTTSTSLAEQRLTHQDPQAASGTSQLT